MGEGGKEQRSVAVESQRCQLSSEETEEVKRKGEKRQLNKERVDRKVEASLRTVACWSL